MHRNTYLPSPQVLDADYSVRQREGLYFAGQITGVEGYVESAASGLVAGWQAALQYSGLSRPERLARLPGNQTVIGSLGDYISDERIRHFQPMNANFGLVADLEEKGRIKKEVRLRLMIERSLARIDQLAAEDHLRSRFVHKSDGISMHPEPYNNV